MRVREACKGFCFGIHMLAKGRFWRALKWKGEGGSGEKWGVRGVETCKIASWAPNRHSTMTITFYSHCICTLSLDNGHCLRLYARQCRRGRVRGREHQSLSLGRHDRSFHDTLHGHIEIRDSIVRPLPARIRSAHCLDIPVGWRWDLTLLNVSLRTFRTNGLSPSCKYCPSFGKSTETSTKRSRHDFLRDAFSVVSPPHV